jgi:phosphoribosylanthranilate isomerase
VFFERSPRFVTAARAAALSARQEGGPLRVGLFVEPAVADIRAVLEVVRLDVLQVYGSAMLCRQIRLAFGLKVWRAVGVAAASDLPAGGDGVDGFHIEAKPPEGATRPGGNALMMDWGVFAGWRSPAPWLLGGGLNATNVAQAIARTGAPGVDVSSGVETGPGEKSPALIRAFVERVRAGA